MWGMYFACAPKNVERKRQRRITFEVKWTFYDSLSGINELENYFVVWNSSLMNVFLVFVVFLK